MKADAIQRVTLALRERLRQAVAATGASGDVFVGPLNDPDAAGAALILFLYRVVPNANLRNREHRLPDAAAPGGVSAFDASLPLDLYFLLTVGTRTGTADGEVSLLNVLGHAMRALQLEPDLDGPGVGYETVHVTLEPLSTEEGGRIWALFPTASYRTSVAYLATPVWIDPQRPRLPPGLVTQDRLNAGTGVPMPTQP